MHAKFYIITGFTCHILLAQGLSGRFVKLSISVRWIMLQLHIFTCTQLWVKVLQIHILGSETFELYIVTVISIKFSMLAW